MTTQDKRNYLFKEGYNWNELMEMNDEDLTYEMERLYMRWATAQGYEPL